MTLRPQVVRERLRKLREILANLETIKSVPRQELPDVPPPAPGPPGEVSMDEPPNVLQDGMVLAAEAARLGRPLTPPEAAAIRATMQTRADAAARIPLRTSQLDEDPDRMY